MDYFISPFSDLGRSPKVAGVAVVVTTTTTSTTTNDPFSHFLDPLFVEPKGGGACRQWGPTRVDLGQSPVCNTTYNNCAC